VLGRGTIEARLRDRSLLTLKAREGALSLPADPKTPKSRRPLEIVQMDHTLVDIMVVDEIHGRSTGWPWVTVAFDVATRVVLGYLLSLHSPSATSVGLSFAMAGLPMDQWLKERTLDLT
jgi:putative transposase